MEGQHGRIRRFAVGPVYPNKSLTMCSSDFVFRKYEQDRAFCVSEDLQLAKTGPPVTKNFPLLRLFRAILVPRGRAPFGQHQESRPLARSNDIPVLNGFVNTID